MTTKLNLKVIDEHLEDIKQSLIELHERATAEDRECDVLILNEDLDDDDECNKVLAGSVYGHNWNPEIKEKGMWMIHVFFKGKKQTKAPKADSSKN